MTTILTSMGASGRDAASLLSRASHTLCSLSRAWSAVSILNETEGVMDSLVRLT